MTDQTTVFEPVSDRPPPTDHPDTRRPAKQRPRFTLPTGGIRLNASAGVWFGLGVAALGFGLIFYSWIRVAAILDVGRQMPYVVSGAMSGLGLIVVGIAVVDLAVRRQDRLERRQQLTLMRGILEELNGTGDERDRP